MFKPRPSWIVALLIGKHISVSMCQKDELSMIEFMKFCFLKIYAMACSNINVETISMYVGPLALKLNYPADYSLQSIPIITVAYWLLCVGFRFR